MYVRFVDWSVLIHNTRCKTSHFLPSTALSHIYIYIYIYSTNTHVHVYMSYMCTYWICTLIDVPLVNVHARQRPIRCVGEAPIAHTFRRDRHWKAKSTYHSLMLNMCVPVNTHTHTYICITCVNTFRIPYALWAPRRMSTVETQLNLENVAIILGTIYQHTRIEQQEFQTPLQTYHTDT